MFDHSLSCRGFIPAPYTPKLKNAPKKRINPLPHRLCAFHSEQVFVLAIFMRFAERSILAAQYDKMLTIFQVIVNKLALWACYQSAYPVRGEKIDGQIRPAKQKRRTPIIRHDLVLH